MSKYGEMLNSYEEQSKRDALDFSVALSGMQEMFLDEQRVVDLYLNADKAILDIDAQFQKVTGLNRRDVAFLMLATALQIGRWVSIALVNRAVSEKIADNRVEHDDDSIKQMEKDKRNQYKEKHKDWDSKKGSGKYRGWQNLAFESVPYDITRGSPMFGIDGTKLLPGINADSINMEGKYHRFHTLGHDPLLGWIFGPMNIISDTITLDKTYAFQTFKVDMMSSQRMWTAKTTMLQAFADTIESLKEDIRRLPAAVFAQALHFKSDEFTKLGLPVPLLETFAPNFESKIYKEGYDSLLLMKDIARIGIQAVSSILINLLIASIHDLFYDPKIYSNHDLYEVKTRKILFISNAISASSNLIWVGGNVWMGNEEAWKDLDIGGLIVTMYRLVTDVKFISRVEKEFLESEWCRTVVGEEYKFIQEVAAMSRKDKDIEKGIEIHAKADAAHERKLADGLEKHAAILQNIEDRQKSVRSTMSTVLQDMKAMEAKVLYGIDPGRSPRNLGDNEKMALCAALYSLMESSDDLSNNQRTFFLNFEKYLGITNRVEGFNYSKLSNIDRNSDRILVLEVICSFLFLENEDFSFLDNKKYAWLRDLAVRKDMDYVCESIRKEYSVVGADGIVDKYIITESVTEEMPPAIEEDESHDVVIETNEDTEPYSALEKLIKAYVTDETAFGKCVNSSPQAAVKEIRAAFPRLDLGTAISVSKVGNGYLLFSTCAFYLKSGSSPKDPYVRIPYSKIIANKISMGLGRAKGTRKLMVAYVNDSGQEAIATIDDTKIQEEKLRDLLKDILKPEYPFADSDMSLNLPELDVKEQELYFKALGNILHHGNYGMTEMYLIMDDYGLSDRWNEISSDFSDDEELESNIRVFLKNIPYPSNHGIPQQAVMLALQTICRTNAIEGRDVSMITDEMEKLIRLFDSGKLGEKAFNDMLTVVADNPRPLDPNVIFYLTQRLDPSTAYYESIKSGADAMAKALEQKIAKKNPVQEVLKDVARFVPDADDIKQGAEKVFAGLRFHGKKETLAVPKEYKQIKKKLPDGAVPKGAHRYGKRTENANCIVVSFPVTEQETMPFEDPQFVIDRLHEEMGEKEGLIEVKNGVTVAGRPYIFNIIKHLDVGPNGEPMKMNYIMNLNVRMENSIQFFNGCFSEEGVTGMRDSIGMALFHKVREQNGVETTEDNIMDGWFRDPYDESYTNGLPKNFSEAEELDERFPMHPLSEARAFVRFIVENN